MRPQFPPPRTPPIQCKDPAFTPARKAMKRVAAQRIAFRLLQKSMGPGKQEHGQTGHRLPFLPSELAPSSPYSGDGPGALSQLPETQVRWSGRKRIEKRARSTHAFFELHETRAMGNPVAFPGHLNWRSRRYRHRRSQPPPQPHPARRFSIAMVRPGSRSTESPAAPGRRPVADMCLDRPAWRSGIGMGEKRRQTTRGQAAIVGLRAAPSAHGHPPGRQAETALNGNRC